MAAVCRLALLVTGCFALSWSGLVASGLHPVMPIPFLFLVLLLIPSAYGLSLTARVRRGRYLPLLGLLLGYHYWLDTAAGLALAPLSCCRPGWSWAAKLGLRQSPGGS